MQSELEKLKIGHTSSGDDRVYDSQKSKQLLDAIRNATKKGPHKQSSLDHVETVDLFSNVQRLLESGADPNVLDRVLLNDGKTCLHYIAMHNVKNSDKIVSLLLSAGALPDIPDNRLDTPLLLAASSKYENVSVIEKLIEARVNVNWRGSRGQMSLHHAAFHKKSLFVRSLLAAGASVNCMDSRNNTPLLLDTRNNNPKGIHNDPRHQRQQRLDIVQQLIAAGALVNVQNAERMTSLLCACSYGDVEIVKLLLSHGGREAPVNVAAKDGYNPLLYAVSSRSIDIVQLLVEAGADINYANSKELKFDPKDWMKDMPRNAALHIAIANDDVDMLEFLLKNGADPNRTSEFEDTALKFAVSEPQNHQLSILKLLLSHGADMYRSGIFEKVVAFGDIAQARFFLENGFDLRKCNPRNPQDFSPLHYAIHYNQSSDMLSLLLEYSNGIFDLEHRDREGQSPLCAAAWIEFPECVEILLKLGANIEHTDSEGRTPLELVSVDGLSNNLDRCEKCIQLLVEAGAKIRDILIKLLPDDTVDHIASIHEDYFKMNYPNNMASFAGLDQHDRHRQLKFCYEKAKFIVKYRVLYESQNLSIEEPMVDENMGKSMKLRSYYEACLAEIVLLQNSSITSSITHHDILTANKYFHKRVRDEKVYESFDEINIWNRFRLYAEDLYDRFKCLNKLHKTWEKSVTNLSLLLGLDSNTYYSIIHNILNHLDENDLVSMTRL